MSPYVHVGVQLTILSHLLELKGVIPESHVRRFPVLTLSFGWHFCILQFVQYIFKI